MNAPESKRAKSQIKTHSTYFISAKSNTTTCMNTDLKNNMKKLEKIDGKIFREIQSSEFIWLVKGISTGLPVDSLGWLKVFSNFLQLCFANFFQIRHTTENFNFIIIC